MINIEKILNEIETLPPLKNTFIELQKYIQREETNIEKLTEIILTDPLLSISLLKIVNSPLFGFKTKVETISKTINLLGENMVLSISMGKLIENTIKDDLKPYNVNNIDFFNSANLAIYILKEWYKHDQKFIEELYFPLFLFQIGKFILSKISKEETLDNMLKTQIKDKEIPNVEKELFGITNSNVSSLLLEKWCLNKDWINILKYVNDIENVPTKYKKSAKVINIIELLVNINDLLNENSIIIAKKRIKEFNLENNFFEETIEKAKEKFNLI